MRYLLLIIIAYFIFRAVGRMLNKLGQGAGSKAEVEGKAPSEKRFGVDESEIEDAEFKDLD